MDGTWRVFLEKHPHIKSLQQDPIFLGPILCVWIEVKYIYTLGAIKLIADPALTNSLDSLAHRRTISALSLYYR